MRTLLVLRGNYFSGQKKFIKENKLKPYLIDLETIRFLAGGYKHLVNSYKSFDYRNAGEIFKTLFEFLELRMKKGEFCVVNAPNANNSILKEYKLLCEKYRYNFFILPFEDINLDECKQKNLQYALKKGIFIPEHILSAIDLALKQEKLGKKYNLLTKENWQS